MPRSQEYTFRMIFSGPCAYVPNTVVGSRERPKSWSVLLPELSQSRRFGDFEISPHFPVLQYPAELFTSDREPDLLFRRPSERELALLELNGHRIMVNAPQSELFSPFFLNLSSDQLKNPSLLDEQSPEIHSLGWLPAMESLLKGAGTVGRSDLDFFNSLAFPDDGALAAHVLLTGGRLVTNSLLPRELIREPGKIEPNVWSFKRVKDFPQELTEGDLTGAAADRSGIVTQAVAYSVALELSGLTEPIEIQISTHRETTVLRLNMEELRGDEVTVEVKNREFEEIVGWELGNIQEGSRDPDFEVLYWFSQKDRDPNRAVPFLSSGSPGVGTRRRTCGGASFEGFTANFANFLQTWESAGSRAGRIGS